MTKLSHKMLE